MSTAFFKVHNKTTPYGLYTTNANVIITLEILSTGVVACGAQSKFNFTLAEKQEEKFYYA